MLDRGICFGISQIRKWQAYVLGYVELGMPHICSGIPRIRNTGVYVLGGPEPHTNPIKKLGYRKLG